MIDRFSNATTSMESPPSRLAAITPSDDDDLGFVTTVINVATAGTVQVTTVDGDTGDVFVAAGVVFPIRATRIWATGTSATGIRGLAG